MPLVRYLLDCGCDPNLGDRSPLKEVLQWGYIEPARLLIRGGADMYSGINRAPDTSLPYFDETDLHDAVSLLSGEDYWSWQTTETREQSGSLLSSALRAGSLRYTMRAIDDFGLPISPCGASYPLWAAITAHKINTSAVLLHLGADINFVSSISEHRNLRCAPLIGAVCFPTHGTAGLHYLLHRGADIKEVERNSSLKQSVWATLWAEILDSASQWAFKELEGLILHLLLHDGWNPDRESDLGKIRTGYGHYVVQGISSLSTFDVAKLWSLYVHPDEEWNNWVTVASDFERGRTRRPSSVTIRWSSRGTIRRLASRQTTSSTTSTPIGDSLELLPPDYELSYEDGRDEIPFARTTLFYENISTERGRRQMSEFPMVRALCNALQLAGYRVDMDEEGDVWFDDDDCDRYYEAREYQPVPGEDDGLVANCPICQDMDKYGLGYILRLEREGIDYLHEFRARNGGKARAPGNPPLRGVSVTGRGMGAQHCTL